jgi:hypothetical protein
MEILSTLGYGKKAYEWASHTTLKALDPILHKGIRLALGNFNVCKSKNIICEAGMTTLKEMRILSEYSQMRHT